MVAHRRSRIRSEGRVCGLAVAVGIGVALVAGTPVASAEPAGESGSESISASSSSSDASTDSTTNDASTPSEPSSEAEKPTAPTEVDEEADNEEPAADTSKKRRDATPGSTKTPKTASTATKQPEPEVRSARSDNSDNSDKRSDNSDEEASDKDASDTKVDDEQVVTSAATTASVTVAPAVQPVVSAEEPPQDPAEVVTTALTTVVSAVLDPFAGDAPTAPAESPLSWMMLAAARREFLGQAPTVNESANPVATDSVAALVASEVTPQPPVAVVQTPPLAWLQQVPVIGPVFVTPIVALLHQIPVISDVIHPLVGYPVQWGLPAGAPAPRDVYVTSFDGASIYVHFMPAVGLAPGKQAPTILVGSGLGLPGATNLDGTLLDGVLVDTFGLVGVGTLRHAGYNVVTWDPRGEWFSGGQLQIDHPEFEGRDVSAIISWLATQPEVLLDNKAAHDPRIGMVGVSYGGGIQLVTAAIDNRVDALVPTIAWHSLNTSLYEAAAPKSSWGVLLTAVLLGTAARFNPQILTSVLTGALTGQLPQSDVDFLTDRSPGQLVDKITVPTLLIQGTVDTLFSLQEADATALALIANGVPTKVVWFCGGHGACLNNLVDFRDGVLIQDRTLAWLDRYVKGNVLVPTGPQFEWVDQSGQWFSSDSYKITPGSPIVATTANGGVLPLLPVIGGSGLPLLPFASKAINAVNLTTPAAATTAYLVGAPKVTFTYSGTGTGRHVYAQLVDDSTGLVLGSQVTPIAVTLDGQTHTVTVDLEPVAHTLKPGQTVTLQLVAEAGTYQELLPTVGELAVGPLKVSSMQLTLPAVDPATVSTTSAGPFTITAA